MSKLKVTTISDPDNDNTAISVDSSGNLTVPQNLTVSGTLSGDGSNLTGINNGITQAEVWALEANFSPGSAYTNYITSNWALADAKGDIFLGDGMSESSGIFTFPVTGLWKIDYQCSLGSTSGSTQWLGGIIARTTNNSTYSNVSGNFDSVSTANYNSAVYLSYIFNVTSTSTHKVKFALDSNSSGQFVQGTVNDSYTRVTFIRLGDAQ